MKHLSGMRLLLWAALFCSLPMSATAQGMGQDAAEQVGIDVVLLADGSSEQQDEFVELFRRELVTLTEGEFEVRFHERAGQWSREGTLDALQRAYDDPEIDMVLVTGWAANQIVATYDQEFAKPTFLPLVFDANLLGLPRAGSGSGHPTMSYLADEIDFSDNLSSFLRVVEFKNLALLVDAFILQATDRVALRSSAIAAARGVETTLVSYDDPDADLVALLPPGTDAVMIDGLERLDDADVDRLIEGLRDAGIPSFSFVGESLVERGLLTADSSESDFQRVARRIALNMQAVMLGEAIGDQPVEFRTERRLYLNLKTARLLDVWPSYEVLVESVLLGDDPGDGGLGWDLAQVADEAVRINLGLLAEQLGTDASGYDVRQARTTLLPQITGDLSVTQLDGGNAAVESGAAAERSTSAAVTVSQLLWSEPVWANLDIQEQLYLGRQAELEQFRLDTVLTATTAFLDVLRTETQVRVQRDNLERTRANLELAQSRVRLGSASRADVYRWESELATARQNSIDAYTQRTVVREQLNQLLNRPFDEPFVVVIPTLEDSYLLMAEGGLADTIDNPRTFRHLVGFQVQRGLAASPELETLRTAVAAKQREKLSLDRSFYSPSVSLQGQISRVLEEDRVGPSLEGENDWSLGLVASLPIFTGGSRRLDVEQTDAELGQLEAQIAAVEEQIALGIRANMYLANASLNKIPLARQAAEASRENLELITDSYSEGVVSILELLDAQSAALQAEEAAENVVFDFLTDLMNVQRASGTFDFFLDAGERSTTLLELQRFLATADQPATEDAP